MQINNYEDASIAYLENLKRLHNNSNRVKFFFRFYNRLSTKTDDTFLSDYRLKRSNSIASNEVQPQIASQLSAFFGPQISISPKYSKIIELLDDDCNLNKIKSIIEKQGDIVLLQLLVDHKIKSPYGIKSSKINEYLVKQAENLRWYASALKLVAKKPKFLENPISTSAVFRICRMQGDYYYIENLIHIDEQYVRNSKFNVLYELVYYFAHKQDEIALVFALQRMEHAAQRSEPIAKTLYNFYLRFNMYENADKVMKHIELLRSHGQRHKHTNEVQENAQIESQKVLAQSLNEMFNEIEHNRRMIALRDLIKGLSHELGQPITNIRYSVQLQQMKIASKKSTPDNIDELLNLILAQTTRVGELLTRFSPIFSKGTEGMFPVYDRIKNIFENLDARLDANGICCTMNGNKYIKAFGDAIQFDQVFYNLILNSMQAITLANRKRGSIYVQITEIPNHVQIQFSDDGPGIPEHIANKIFEPFFSTKEPSSDAGGEGLGLFIVWNILKKLNGSISLDKQQKQGAKFTITIPKQEE
jgi:signal transduction histidine kinase